MKDEAVARRYAAALLEVVGSEAEAVDAALSRLARDLSATEASRIWLHPALGAEAKRGLVRALATEEDPPVVTRFLDVVIAHRREAEVATIAESFHQAVLERAGLTEAVIASGRPLAPEEQARATEALSRFLGRRLWPRFEVDPSLIGGVRVTFGDRMIDWSVQGALDRLRANLLAAREEVKA
ncbi:MAG: ATP synthase F1 subunit delta [Firmicutes bacterium]|nr:ATP synthase F1 subunit delta [Alicyclobacillaceae bacterium]MCL6497697.1 ATP synthase F1 subunit delta [Bacillota bacterium]